MIGLDRGAILLILLPFALLAIDSNWIFSSLFRDPWLYFGYYLDLPTHLAAFPKFYYSGRLSMTLPGYLAYRLLPAELANYGLHITLFEASVLSLYATLRPISGRRSALLAALAMGMSFFFRDAIGHDYTDAYGITYLLLAIWLLLLAARSARGWRPGLILAGASVAALVVVNVSFLLYVPILALTYLVANGAGRRHSLGVSLMVFGLGAGALLAGLAWFHWRITGRFWFLGPSFRFARTYVTETPDPLRLASWYWLDWVVWLVMPVFSAVGALLWLARTENQGTTLERYLQCQLLLMLAALLGASEARHFNFLGIWFYANLLIPASFLAFGVQIGRLVNGLTPRQYLALVLTATAAFSLGMFFPREVVPLGRLARFALGASLALGAAAWGVFWGGRPGVARGVVFFVLFGLMLWGAQLGFLEEKSVPFMGKTLIADNYSPPAGSPRLEPYAVRMRSYDRRRRSVFRAITRAMRAARDDDPAVNTRFWFDQADPHSVVFDNISAFYLCDHRLLNLDFLDPRGGVMLDGRRIAPGLRVVILSSRTDGLALAEASLRRIGLGATLIEEFRVREPGVEFSVTVVRVKALRSDRAFGFPAGRVLLEMSGRARSGPDLEGLGLFVPVQLVKDPGVLVEALDDHGVARAEGLLLDLEGALEEGRGRGEVSLVALQQREIEERLSNKGMVRPERLLLDGQGAPQERLRPGELALLAVEVAEVVESLGEERVVGAERLRLDGQRALKEGLGLGVFPLHRGELAHEAQRVPDAGMVATEGLLPDRQRAAKPRLGLGELPLGQLELGQVGQGVRQVGRLDVRRLLPDREGLLVMKLGLAVTRLDMIELPQVVQARRHVGMLAPQALLRDRERPSIERLGLGVAALKPVELGHVVEGPGQLRVLGPKPFLGDGQGAAKERLGLAVSGLRRLDDRQRAQTLRDVLVLRSERPQRLDDERLDSPDVGRHRARADLDRADLLGFADRGLEQPLGFGVPSLPERARPAVVQLPPARFLARSDTRQAKHDEDRHEAASPPPEIGRHHRGPRRKDMARLQ